MNQKEYEKHLKQLAEKPQLIGPMRRAWICTSQSHDPDRRGIPYRVFLTSEPQDYIPTCPEHGKTMKRQINQPYMGKLVPTV